MNTHAMAMVKWKVFRPGRRGEVVFDYGSDQKRLVNIVGTGGTLWLVTSRRKTGNSRRYHLAYKLVDCTQIPSIESTFSGQYKYVVRAKSWDESIHYRFNDVTETLRRLKFTSGQPMAQITNIGLRLLSIPELTPNDVELLQRFEHKIRFGKTVFLSYSRRNRILASRLERELEKRDVLVSRDFTFLRPGQEWEEAIEREAKSTNCFMVLISPDAARSHWVNEEVKWAVSEYEAGGLVKRIVPVVHHSGGWNSFSTLHRFHRIDLPTSASKEFYDQLAKDIAAVK